MLFSHAVASTELIWMMDDSYSVAKSNYQNAKVLIRNINNLILGDKRYSNTTAFGLLEFGSRITGAEPLTYDYSKFKKQLKVNRFGSAGNTRISTAFEYVNEKMFNKNKTVDNRVIAIITDGAPNPGLIYGGPALVSAVNSTFEEHGLDRLVYIMVSNSIGYKKANPHQFKKVRPYYDAEEDFVSVNFKKKITSDIAFDIYCKLVENCFEDYTDAPTTSPTWAPTGSPSVDDYYSTYSNSTYPDDYSSSFYDTDAPTDTPTTPGTLPRQNDDNSLDAGLIALIIFAFLTLLFIVGAVAYTRGVENN